VGSRKTGESLICAVVSLVRFSQWDTEISTVPVFWFSAISWILAISAMGWWDTEISTVPVFWFSAISWILAISAMGWVAVYNSLCPIRRQLRLIRWWVRASRGPKACLNNSAEDVGAHSGTSPLSEFDTNHLPPSTVSSKDPDFNLWWNFRSFGSQARR